MISFAFEKLKEAKTSIMKIFAVLFTFCVACSFAAITGERQLKLLEYRDGCKADSGVSDVAIENAKAGVFAVGDDKLKNFALCFLKKIKFINADGVFDVAALRAKISADYPKAEAEKIIAQCIPLSGANAAETAVKRFQCFLENKTISILN